MVVIPSEGEESMTAPRRTRHARSTCHSRRGAGDGPSTSLGAESSDVVPSEGDIIARPEVAMIKADIVNKVAEMSEISRVKAAQAVDTVIEGLRNALARGQRIELRGFGVFQVKQRKKGIGRNPKTGVEVKIPPGNTIRFKPGKELRNLL